MEAIQDLSVTVNRVIFANPSQGFAIFSVVPSSKRRGVKEDLVAKGHVGDLSEGDSLIISGKWVSHPKYGDQIQVEGYRLPDIGSGEGIYEFLKSGFIKGVGASLAKTIVKHFGESTNEVLNNEPQRLLEVSGIGKKKQASIVTSWKEHAEKRSIIVKLQEWGIGPATIQKIFKSWKNPQEIIPGIEQNPYVLTEIENVGFLIADKIAQNIGIKKDSEHRIGAAVCFALEEAGSKDGHIYLVQKQLVEKTKELLTIENEKNWERKIINCFAWLSEESRIIIEDDRIYHPRAFYSEKSLANNTLRLLGHGISLAYQVDLDGLLDSYQKRENIIFDATQKEAIKSILDNKVSIVTGGPGTGKTTIVNAAIEILESAGVSGIGLVAPTGRAAKRMEESTGREAKTIHRYLGYRQGQGFTVNKNNRSEDELIICDESSMLDVYLSNALVSALQNEARIVFIGDVYQLPSVGAGNILRDMINSGRVPTVELKQIHRQAEGSWISLNAHAVKNGKLKDVNLSNDADDFFWLSVPLKDGNEQEIPAFERCAMVQKKIFGAMNRLLEIGYDFDDIQILTPMRKTNAGVVEINKQIQLMLNKKLKRRSVQIGFRRFAVGDRVMQLKNNYEKDVYNGDQGKVFKIDEDESKVFVKFGNHVLEYSFLEADELDLAYACTVHKSQGSEYKIAIIPVTTSHFIMLQRNLLYTAITRAKEKCVLIGEKKALSIAVKNDKPIIRNTTLTELLSA